MSSWDVVVVGAGVVGCAAAWSLAREGFAVLLLERDHPGAHASSAAAGMLAPLCESEGEGPLFRLGVRALESFPAEVAELEEVSGITPEWVRSGVLRPAFTSAQAGELRAHAAHLQLEGLEWLEPEAVRLRAPYLAPNVQGALWSPREGHVQGALLNRALVAALLGRDVSLRTGAEVIGLLRQGNRITGVRLAGPGGEEEIAAGWVVMASGAWTGLCSQWLGFSVPVTPVRGQILALEGPARPIGPILWGEGIYVVTRRSGEVVVGATVEDAGFDCRNTAEGVVSLLRGAAELAPCLAGCSLRRAWAGLRPGSPDGLPWLGPVPGWEGVLLAAGHYRNGILLSLLSGRLVADHITGRPLDDDARALLPGRGVAHGGGAG